MLATALVGAIVAVVAAASAGSVVLAADRAQDAADAAALAAVHAREAVVPPAAAAAAAAARHGAQLVTCDCARAEVRVTVRVPVSARAARLAGVASRTATAHARLVPLGLAPVAGEPPRWPHSRAAPYARRTI